MPQEDKEKKQEIQESGQNTGSTEDIDEIKKKIAQDFNERTKKYEKEYDKNVEESKKDFKDFVNNFSQIKTSTSKYTRLLLFTSLIIIIFLVFSFFLLSFYVFKYKADTRDLINRFDITLAQKDECFSIKDSLETELSDFKSKACVDQDLSRGLIKSSDYQGSTIGAFKLFENSLLEGFVLIREYDADGDSQYIDLERDENAKLIFSSYIPQIENDRYFDIVDFEFINDRLYVIDPVDDALKGYDLVIGPEPGIDFVHVGSYPLGDGFGDPTGVDCGLTGCEVVFGGNEEVKCYATFDFGSNSFNDVSCEITTEEVIPEEPVIESAQSVPEENITPVVEEQPGNELTETT